jgi:cell division protease FtsH
MSHNFDPDISANEFHELSLKISVTQIKSALKSRFRNEQIARLGNTHIIYPAFSTKSFYKIIDLELNKISDKVYKSQNIKLEFDKTIKDIIYKEGVYPTQGTRPIFTTIYNIISTKIGKIIVEAIIKNLKVDKVKFSFKNEKVVMSYFIKNVFIHKIEETQILKLEKLRENKNDDLQTIVAVHESGHALSAIFLLNTIPETIHSISVNNENLGSTYTKFSWEYISKKEIEKRIAVV